MTKSIALFSLKVTANKKQRMKKSSKPSWEGGNIC